MFLIYAGIEGMDRRHHGDAIALERIKIHGLELAGHQYRSSLVIEAGSLYFIEASIKFPYKVLITLMLQGDVMFSVVNPLQDMDRRHHGDAIALERVEIHGL
jgi:hypothetical protein